MATKITDKRGQNHQPKLSSPKSSELATPVNPSPTKSSGATILQANADGSIKEVAPENAPQVLLLTPFPDGTCLKGVARPWPGKAENKPADYDKNPQWVLLNSARQQLAIAKDQAVAALICDAVNVLFAAQEQADIIGRKQAQEAEDLTMSICGGKVK